MEQVHSVVNSVMAKAQDPKSTRASSTHQNGSDENMSLLETPPRVKPQHMPEEIFRHYLDIEPHERIWESQEYKAIHSYLSNYRKAGGQWEEYVLKAKIPPRFREMMARIWAECRRNGFCGPTAAHDKGRDIIMFRQVVEPRVEKPRNERLKWTLCNFCERRCPSKDWKGVPHEPRRCGDMDSYGTLVEG